MIDNTKEEKDEIETLLEEFVQSELNDSTSDTPASKPKKTTEEKVSKPPRIEKMRVA